MLTAETVTYEQGVDALEPGGCHQIVLAFRPEDFTAPDLADFIGLGLGEAPEKATDRLGFSVGLWGVINGATWPHYYGRDGLGGVQGSAMTVILIASAVAPLPVAFLHSVTNSHTAGISLLLGTAVASLWVRRHLDRLDLVAVLKSRE